MHMSKHMTPWRNKEHMLFLKNAHKFQKISYSGIISFVYVGKEEMLKLWYEVSMTACMGRIANQRKIPKWLPFKNYRSESLNISCAYEYQI